MTFLESIFDPAFWTPDIIGLALAVLGLIYGGYRWVVRKRKGRADPEEELYGLKDQVAGLKKSQDELLRLLRERLAHAPGTLAGALPGPGVEGFGRDLAKVPETLAREGGARGAEALERLRESGDIAGVKKLLAELAAGEEKAMGHAGAKAADYWRQAGALAFLTDTDEALRAYAKAAELDPDNAEGWFQLGQLQQRAGNSAAAEASFRKVLALGNRAGRTEAYWSQLLLGDTLATRGLRGEALALYRKAENEARAALAADPASTEWQRDLSVSQNKIGDILKDKGDRDGALAAYRAGLAIAEKLAARDPANTEWQTDLAVSNYKLAQLGGPDARARLEAALAILKRLGTEGKLTAGQKGWIGLIEGMLNGR